MKFNILQNNFCKQNSFIIYGLLINVKIKIKIIIFQNYWTKSHTFWKCLLYMDIGYIIILYDYFSSIL